METFLTKALNTVQGHKAKNQGGSSGWIAGIGVGLVALIAIALFAYKAWAASKQLAKLLHEKAVREEEAHRTLVASKIAKDEAIKEDALKRVRELNKDILEITQEVKALTQEKKETLANIDKLSSWDDVDEFLNKGNK